MTFIPTDDCALAIIEYVFDGQQFTNGLWFTKDSFTLADQTNLADAVDAETASELLPAFSDDVTYLKTTVYDQRSETAPVVINNDGTGPGSAATEPTPINVAMVLTLYTASRGRTARGRLYVSGFSENAITDGEFTQAMADIVVAWGNALDAAADAIGWTWSVVSKQVGGVPRASGLARPVTTIEVRDLKVGTQRRRVDRP